MALLIGTIAGLANAIPFLGPLIGLVIALAYSLIAESITPVIPGLNPNDLAIYVVVLVAVVHFMDNLIFQPVVLGSAVNLHPLVVIVAIIAGSLTMFVGGILPPALAESSRCALYSPRPLAHPAPLSPP